MSADFVFNTMSGIWNTIVRALTEARDPVDSLYNYVLQRHGEDEADQVRGAFHAWPANEFSKMIKMRYMDPKVDGLVSAAIVARNPEDAKPTTVEPKKSAGRPVVNRSRDDDDGPSSSTDKGSLGAEPIPARPDRAGTKASPMPPRVPVADPRSKHFQQVGSAGQNPAQPQPSQAIIPKTDKTKELERMHSLLQDEDWISQKVHDYIKKNNVPQEKIGGIRARLVSQIKAKIQTLGNDGASTIKRKTGMEPDKFFKHGGAKKDLEDMPDKAIDAMAKSGDKSQLGTQAGPTPPIDPDTGGVRRGDFVGQHYGRNGFSRPAKDRVNPDGSVEKGDFGKNPELDSRRAGGMTGKKFQYGNAATGKMKQGSAAANPAKPDDKWREGHDMWWAGDKHGWVTKSQFATLAASGQLRRKGSSDPSKPDLSKHSVVSPPGSPKKPT